MLPDPFQSFIVWLMPWKRNVCELMEPARGKEYGALLELTIKSLFGHIQVNLTNSRAEEEE
jgi:hypothetical protein